MRKYILGIILTLLVSLSSIFISDTKALDSDYKNNLLKVDVTKNADGSYKIDLFTQKPYNEPIKVRKKSDTSYYVLLPETYHSITSVGTVGDVSNVDVKLYPYAGQDLNNGYTKINIQTSKPVTFSTNVKTAGAQVPKIDSKKLAQLDSAFEDKPSYAPVKVEQVQKPVVKTQQPAETNTVKVQPVAKPKETQPQNRIAAASNNEIEIVTKPKTVEIPQEPKQEIILKDKQPAGNLEEIVDPDVAKEDTGLEQEAKDQGLTEIATGEDEIIPVLTKKEQVKQTAKALMKSMVDNFLLLFAVVLLIIAIILLALPKAKKTSEEQKEDVILTREGLNALNKSAAANNALKEKKEKDVPPAAAQYDVYEAGHIEPAPQNQEITEPAVIEPLPVSEIEEAPAPEPLPVQPFEVDEIISEPVPVEDEVDDEADVLAQESFGDGRGLCLVNYEGSIALIGYINDEIFVIQNFGKVTLINPNIQVRVAEQNDNDTIYIVKAANSKLMVKETKTFIGLEMVM